MKAGRKGGGKRDEKKRGASLATKGGLLSARKKEAKKKGGKGGRLTLPVWDQKLLGEEARIPSEERGKRHGAGDEKGARPAPSRTTASPERLRRERRRENGKGRKKILWSGKKRTPRESTITIWATKKAHTGGEGDN